MEIFKEIDKIFYSLQWCWWFLEIVSQKASASWSSGNANTQFASIITTN